MHRYEAACKQYDFESLALKLGMLMTTDGSGDEKIHLQSIGDVTFSDRDGGSVGNPSDDD